MTALTKALKTLSFYANEYNYDEGPGDSRGDVHNDGGLMAEEAHAELKAYIEEHVMIKISDCPYALRTHYEDIGCYTDYGQDNLLKTAKLLHHAIKEHKGKHNGNA